MLRTTLEEPLIAQPSQMDASKNAIVFQRYYHLFERNELVALVDSVPGARVVECIYDKSNWCIVFERACA